MYPQFDRRRLRIESLALRQHDVFHDSLLPLEELPERLDAEAMRRIGLLGTRIVAARQRRATVLLIMGAHVIRSGVARQLIDLMHAV